jgi:zinc-binding in reverse transcriptase
VNLHLSGVHNNGPPFWRKTGSFFWKSLHSIYPDFLRCISYDIKAGTDVSFWYDWYDPWCGPPLIQISKPQPRPPRQRISVKRAAWLLSTLLPQPRSIQQEQVVAMILHTTFTDQPDNMEWVLTTHRVYTANSFYNFFAGTGKTRFAFPPLWRVKAPLSVKLFFHALITDKLLTQHMLRRRKIQHIQTGCLMCRQCPSKSTLHLFFLCPFAISLWMTLQQHYRFPMISPNPSMIQIMQKGYDEVRGRKKSDVSLWCSIIMAAC